MEHLSLCTYEVFDDIGAMDLTEQTKFFFLENEGFETAQHELNLSFEEVVEWKNNLQPNGEIPCDGLVIKPNRVDKTDTERQMPLNMCAFKPNLQMAVSTVQEIEWSMQGRYLSPVAIIEPVELEGTTVERASLANINVMQGIYVGAQVMVAKRGLIIPKIEKILNPKADAFEIPKTCPACGGQLVVNDSGMVECPNEACPRKVGHRFKKMFKTFGIKLTGDKFVQNLENAGITIEDFLKMCANDNPKVLNKYAGGVNGEKIYQQMKNLGPISAAKFLATFDAPFLDEKRFLLFGNKTLNDLIMLYLKGKDAVMSFKGIGEEIADVYIDFFKKNKDEISALRKYFTFESVYDIIIPKGEEKVSKIAGKSFCFTGKACKPRKELQEIVSKNGGINKDSVVKGLDFLVTDDTESGSAKNKKAKELGIPVISSVDFLMMAAG